MKEILVFNGVHSSGKSTLAQSFSREHEGFTYFHEIGGQLRQEVTYNALESGESFDIEVMKREIARDYEILNCTNTPLVETWHLGNMAYALTRAPKLFDKYKIAFEQQLELFMPRAVLVLINWDIFRKRATEKIPLDQMDELVDFYDKVLEHTYKIYETFNIDYFHVKNEGLFQESIASLRDGLIIRELLKEGITKGAEKGTET
jgi:hypothetical protein